MDTVAGEYAFKLVQPLLDPLEQSPPSLVREGWDGCGRSFVAQIFEPYNTLRKKQRQTLLNP